MSVIRDEMGADMSRSVRRLIRLYELFEAERHPLTSQDICVALEAPRSSVASLLKTLVDLDMLALDRKSATYFPSARFAQLGNWILATWLPPQEFLDMMSQLRDATVETVVLTTPADLEMEVVHVVGGLRDITLVVKPGQRFPIWSSAVGATYLSTQPLATTTALMKRLVRRGIVAADDPQLMNLPNEVRRAREQRYAAAYHSIISDIGIVAMPVPRELAPKPLVISVGGPADRIRKVEALIVAHLRSFLNAVMPPAALPHDRIRTELP